MKTKVIYSKISPEHKHSYKECDSAKLSQSQISNLHSAIKNDSNFNKIKILEEEIKNLREENEYLKSNNNQYCKQINVFTIY